MCVLGVCNVYIQFYHYDVPIKIIQCLYLN